jgi:hypothetical protein
MSDKTPEDYEADAERLKKTDEKIKSAEGALKEVIHSKGIKTDDKHKVELLREMLSFIRRQSRYADDAYYSEMQAYEMRRNDE